MPSISFKDAAILSYLSRNPNMSSQLKRRMADRLSPAAATIARNRLPSTQTSPVPQARRKKATA